MKWALENQFLNFCEIEKNKQNCLDVDFSEKVFHEYSEKEGGSRIYFN